MTDSGASTRPAASRLRHRVLRAGAWSIAGHGVSQVLRLTGNLVMTRILVPEMFGVMAIATTVLVILSMLFDIGLRQNIVQSRRGDDPAFLDTAWVMQIFRGLLLWTISLLVAGALAFANTRGMVSGGSVYASPELPLVIAINSFAAVLMGLQSTGMATAWRSFDQRRLVLLELVGQLAGLIVALVSGYLSRSIWALVLGGLVGTLVTTILSHTWMTGRVNRFRLEREALRELMGFGRWLAVSSAMTVLAIHGDRLLLGAFVDASLLGMYAIAALLFGAVEGAVGRFLSATALPAWSEIARTDPARLRESYYKLRVPADLILLFMAGFLYAAGQRVVDLLYDPRYSAAGGMLQVLAIAFVSARYSVASHIYLAVGNPRYLAILNTARCVSLFTVVPIMFHAAGLQAAIWGIALHGMVMVPFVHAFNTWLGLNDGRREVLVLVALPVGYFIGGVAILIGK